VPDPARLRILEIGSIPYFKTAFPKATTFYATTPIPGSRAGSHVLSLANLRELWDLAHAPGFDLIVCRPPFFAPWNPVWLLRALFSRRTLRGEWQFVPAFGSQLVRGRLAAPLAIMDQEDVPHISRHNFHLLDSCRLYFKRELPIDHWRVFQRTGHRDVPTPRFRASPRQRKRLEKLRPISLGLPPDGEAALPSTLPEKTVDVFFHGEMLQSSTVRARGMAELMALREEGVSVDLSEQRLPLPEFYARMARARLVWSPEGLGWDCFRHYEAAACGSVPVMSRPTIERHCPLIEGEHTFYYDTEPGNLGRTIRAALADPARLDAMAAAARAYVLKHHTIRALATHIVDSTLAADPSR
jgi:hypothetical protein